MSHRATETVSRLPEQARFARLLINRLGRFIPLRPGSRIVDVGCAAGALVLALKRMGYDAVGVEPDLHARRTAGELAEKLGERIPVLEGQAEELPLSDASVDLVIANSVLEHVKDLSGSLKESRRVLRPGGGLWFYSTSALCPRQREIRGFPLFGWYPLGLKRRIMRWATRHRPELVGHTANPAYHWFTPRSTRKLLREAGFGKSYNRWQLRRPDEGGRLYRLILSVILTLPPIRFLGDILIPDSAYLATVDKTPV